jgi:hypothetical protein
MDLIQQIQEEKEPFGSDKTNIRRVIASVSDIIEQIFSNVTEIKQVTSKTASTHDVNIGRCDNAFNSIQNIHSSSPTPRSSITNSNVFSTIAAVATAAAIRTTSSSFDNTNQDDKDSTLSTPLRDSSSSWEASAAEAELSADLLVFSGAATKLADNIRKFSLGLRVPLPIVLPKEKKEEKEDQHEIHHKESVDSVDIATMEIVSTCLGYGKVQSKRQDGFLVVELQWTLSDGKHAIAYVLPSNLK